LRFNLEYLLKIVPNYIFHKYNFNFYVLKSLLKSIFSVGAVLMIHITNHKYFWKLDWQYEQSAISKSIVD